MNVYIIYQMESDADDLCETLFVTEIIKYSDKCAYQWTICDIKKIQKYQNELILTLIDTELEETQIFLSELKWGKKKYHTKPDQIDPMHIIESAFLGININKSEIHYQELDHCQCVYFHNDEDFLYVQNEHDSVLADACDSGRIKTMNDNEYEQFLKNMTLFDNDKISYRHNVRCSDIVFCSSLGPEHWTLTKYPIFFDKILLFISGYYQSDCLIAILPKDILPIIFKFFQLIRPLLATDNTW